MASARHSRAAVTVERSRRDPTGLDRLGDLLAEHYDRVRLSGAAHDDDGDDQSPQNKE